MRHIILVLATAILPAWPRCAYGQYAGQSTPVDSRSVRVRLLEAASPGSAAIGAKNGEVMLRLTDSGRLLAIIGGSDRVVMRVRGDDIAIDLGDGVVYARSVELAATDPASIQVTTNDRTQRAYAGRITVDIDTGSRVPRLRLINTVDLETYVMSVVAGEYGLDDVEGTRAMAVLARTYAVRRSKVFDGYEVVDNTLSQVYAARTAGESVKSAVRYTEGLVLTHAGSLAEATYFASSGGHTADNDAVWDGRPVPYLRGRPDPFDDVSPYARWDFSVAQDELHEALSKAFGVRVTGFGVAARSADGRAQTIRLDVGRSDTLVKANDFRLAIIRKFGARSLRSTLFDAEEGEDSYRFSGRGFGHGVGLSQWGAHGMALKGHTYEEILAFYFPGTSVERLSDVENRTRRIERPVARAPVVLAMSEGYSLRSSFLDEEYLSLADRERSDRLSRYLARVSGDPSERRPGW